jgi:CBS domain-containing protein
MGVEERIKVVEVLALGIDPPVIADAETSLREIVREMRDRRVSCALLTREDRLAGVFTERDVVTRVAGVHGALDGPVAEVMTPDPEHIRRGDRLSTALRLMHRRGYRHIPVVDDDGRPLGCVRHKDVVDYLAQVYPTEVLNLPPNPEQVILTQEGG